MTNINNKYDLIIKNGTIIDDTGKKSYKADLNVLDWDNVKSGNPYIVNDLPANGKRLMQETTGYEFTIVSGIITYAKGKPTGKLPGNLVRND